MLLLDPDVQLLELAILLLDMDTSACPTVKGEEPQGVLRTESQSVKTNHKLHPIPHL